MALADLVSDASQLSKWSRTAPSTHFAASSVDSRSLSGRRRPDRDEAGHERRSAGEQILARDLRRLAVLDQIAIGAHAFQDRSPEPGLVRATFRRRDRVAVGLDEPSRAGVQLIAHSTLPGTPNLS